MSLILRETLICRVQRSVCQLIMVAEHIKVSKIIATHTQAHDTQIHSEQSRTVQRMWDLVHENETKTECSRYFFLVEMEKKWEKPK